MVQEKDQFLFEDLHQQDCGFPTHRVRETHTQRQSERQRHRDTETERQRQGQRLRDRETETEPKYNDLHVRHFP